MPANIAHMLIVYKALNRIQAQNIKPINDLIDQFLDPTYRAFVNLGSISPDLFYYNSLMGMRPPSWPTAYSIPGTQY